VKQIDLAVTLCLLLGLPIPRNSLGVLLVPAFTGLPLTEQLKAAYVNARQVLAVVADNVEDIERRKLMSWSVHCFENCDQLFFNLYLYNPIYSIYIIDGVFRIM